MTGRVAVREKFGGWAGTVPGHYRYGEHPPEQFYEEEPQDFYRHGKVTIKQDAKGKRHAYAFGRKLRPGDLLSFVVQEYDSPTERHSYFTGLGFSDAEIAGASEAHPASHEIPTQFRFSQHLKRWAEAPIFYNEKDNRWFIMHAGIQITIDNGTDVRVLK